MWNVAQAKWASMLVFLLLDLVLGGLLGGLYSLGGLAWWVGGNVVVAGNVVLALWIDWS